MCQTDVQLSSTLSIGHVSKESRSVNKHKTSKFKML